MENLSFLSSLSILLVCCWANSKPPSSEPTMPSAIWAFCQTRVHFAPASITPGIAVTTTSRGPGGTGAGLDCAASWLQKSAEKSRRRDVAVMQMLYHHASAGKSGGQTEAA